MTESMSFFHERAAEIIAAYGGDPLRWPEAERATALAVIASDPVLTAALAEAGAFDHDLAGWARTPVREGDPVAAAAFAMRRPRNFMAWATGGSIAASLIAAAVLLTPPRAPVPVAPAVATATISDETAFAHVFTPTPDEEKFL